ncbi:hypothetical protein OPT61_g561 [Boeremia exigua]|uniref:Uncharacterized protein n=1 Tax=Boeremia exigua TaxID=749465 RepID=A0ACC2ITH6_9PLEO|nr:hypothetical protein OPT61_g561 [Boeremia exigua]
MPPQQAQSDASKEAQIQLALQALKQDTNLSLRRAAAIYSVPRKTLSDRRAGRPSRADAMPNSRGLDNNKEQLSAVANMANSLRAERNLGPVSTNWPSTFVKRQLELKVRFNWKYDYKRAKYEDPEVIRGWFCLVENTKAKYSILDDNTYNFDKAGFMIGIILTGAVVTALKRQGRPKTNWVIGVSSNGWTTNELGFEWLKHFDRHTKERTVGTYRLLVIDGHESHESLQFQQYCKDNKIVTLCMPPHSSHLLQPLDISHLTKAEFLPCFKAAYNAVFTASNIQGGFRGAGLVSFDLERVISGLDVKLRTLSPPLPANNVPWQSQTPSNILEFGFALEHYAKGGAILSHKLVLAQQEIKELRAANKAATQQKSHKRKQVQKEGTLIVEDGQQLAALKEFGARGDGKRAKKQVRAQEGEPA